MLIDAVPPLLAMALLLLNEAEESELRELSNVGRARHLQLIAPFADAFRDFSLGLLFFSDELMYFANLFFARRISHAKYFWSGRGLFRLIWWP